MLLSGTAFGGREGGSCDCNECGGERGREKRLDAFSDSLSEKLAWARETFLKPSLRVKAMGQPTFASCAVINIVDVATRMLHAVCGFFFIWIGYVLTV